MRKFGILASALALAAGTFLGTSAASAAALEENIVEVTAANYESVLTTSNSKVVIFDFGAPWCGPCQKMKPHIQKLAREGADKGKWLLAEVNVDNNKEISKKYNIQYIPTLIPVRNKAEYPDSREIGFGGDVPALERYIKEQIAKG